MTIKLVTDANFLRQKSEPVATVAEAKEIVAKLKEALLAYEGYGLSAIQIGIPKQVAVIRSKHTELVAIINPVIVEKEGEFGFEGEGCLSFPGVFAKTRRYQHYVIKNQVIDGDAFREETQYYYYEPEDKEGRYTDLEAIAAQHEIDHFSCRILPDFGTDVYSNMPIKRAKKVGRNEPCPCGLVNSQGKRAKYKNCCLSKKIFE